MKLPVVLVGFSGAGKTLVGQTLRDEFGWEWIDLDTQIEKLAGQSIKNIIRVEGEGRFREMEREVLLRELRENVVISTGGGILTQEDNKQILLSKALIVHLDVSSKISAQRIEAEQLEAEKLDSQSIVRPLITVPVKERGISYQDSVNELMQARKGLYDVASIRVFTDWQDEKEIAKAINFEINIMNEKDNMKSVFPVQIETTQQESSVVVGQSIVSNLSDRLQAMFSKLRKVALIVDEKAYASWEDQLQLALAQYEVVKIEVPSGEKSKALSVAENMLEQMLDAGLTRDDAVVAFGGGVVGDLSGLVASLYMRGIGLVHIPTTIVSQVDSAIGGKTGVNLSGGKNTVGTFRPADLTFSDVEFLTTLDDREYRSGLAEVVKYGLIYSSDFYNWIEVNIDKIMARDLKVLKEMVEFCTRAKLDFVLEDLEDKTGLRAKLNFGHTVGHALEKLTGYGELLHGEAVAIGMIQALKFGESLGSSQKGITERVVGILESLHLPTEMPSDQISGDKEVLKKRWFDAISADKKRSSDEISFIFVSEIGKSSVDMVTLQRLVDWVIK